MQRISKHGQVSHVCPVVSIRTFQLSRILTWSLVSARECGSQIAFGLISILSMLHTYGAASEDPDVVATLHFVIDACSRGCHVTLHRIG